MGLVGADIDQMRALVRTLSEAADRLEGTTGAVTSWLSSVTWTGPDAEHYRSQWRGESQARMRAVVAALREAAHTVERNAAEQEQASAAGGSTGWTGGTGLPPSITNVLPGRIEDANPLVDIRDFLNSNAVWPITWGALLGKYDNWSALPLLDALGLASDSSLTDGERILQAQNSMTDLAGGLLKARGGYLAGVAVTQWGDVFNAAAQADFSASGLQTVTNYMFSDPGGAFDAAKDAVVGYVPKLFSNLLPW